MGFEEQVQKQSPKQSPSQSKHMVFKFHFHVPHLHILHHHNHNHHVPKGCVAILVGNEGDEEGLHRFVVPLMFLSHPLFLDLLTKAEKEYGFKHAGPITIPCGVDKFKRVQDIIDEETHHRHSHGNGHNNHNHQHNNHLRCL